MIEKLYRIYKSKLALIQQFKECKKFLIPGKYKFDETLTYLHLDNEENFKISKDLFSNLYVVKNCKKKKFILYLLRFKFTKKLEINLETQIFFKGTIFFVSSSGNSQKIFDVESKQVLTIYKHKNELLERVSNYRKLSELFPMPNIIKLNDEECWIIEELIEYKPYQEWTVKDFENVIQSMFSVYENYFSRLRKCYKNGSTFVKDNISKLVDKELLFDRLVKSLPDTFMEEKIPYINVHGDLWSSNILLKNTEIYIIDWEHNFTAIFYYDIFFYFWSEYLENNNDYYIKEFFNGTYDEYFSNLFNYFNLYYRKHSRLDYFNYFMINYYTNRLSNSSDNYKKVVDMKYNDIQNFFE